MEWIKVRVRHHDNHVVIATVPVATAGAVRERSERYPGRRDGIGEDPAGDRGNWPPD